MSRNNIITEHYKKNYRSLVKKMTFRAGTEWDAEDIVQEAYVRALKYYRTFDGENFGKWFSTIINNTLRDHKNNEKGIVTHTFDEELEEGINCNHYTERVIAEVREMINKRQPEQREVLNLYFTHGYLAKEIPEFTDYSYKAAHQIIQRFRNELKELYK